MALSGDGGGREGAQDVLYDGTTVTTFPGLADGLGDVSTSL